MSGETIGHCLSLALSRQFLVCSLHFATFSFFSIFCLTYNWGLVSSSLSSARAKKREIKMCDFVLIWLTDQAKKEKKSAVHENGCKFCATTLDASANSLVSFWNQAWQRTRAFCTTIYMTGKSVPQLCTLRCTHSYGLWYRMHLIFFCVSSVDSIIQRYIF